MFLGEYQHNIDPKGRLIIPAKFREDLGEQFVLSKGLDGCLFVYPLKEWQELENKLRSLPLTQKDARFFPGLMKLSLTSRAGCFCRLL